MELVLENKRKRFKRMFGDKYSVKLLNIQMWNERDGKCHVEVAFTFGELMTALEIQNVCEKIAKWLGGCLYGTVNIDFSGTTPSLEMIVEMPE